MTMHSFDPCRPQGFTLSDPSIVIQKLTRFAQAGAEQIYFLFDFDRTLTTSKHTGVNTTTWQILHGLLSTEGQRMSDAIRDKYLALEENGNMTLEESHAFSTTLLNLHASHGTNRHDMERAAKQIRLRDGTEALFAACETAHIPTVILSAGIRDIIELIARENDIHPTLLVSIKLQFADDGRITGWDEDSMVLTNNKHESVKQWVSHITTARPYTVLVGDTLEDARMVEGKDTVLRIRVCDAPDTDNQKADAYRQKSFDAGYDMIIEEDLSPLVPLTQWLAQEARNG
jgi:HAD superfamily phosphoserine phosphatase-like hydrolase